MAEVKVSTYNDDRIILPQGNGMGATIYVYIRAGYAQDKKVRKILWNDRVMNFESVADGKDFLVHWN